MLSKIAVNYLGVCCSSAEKELTFSLLSNVIDKKRNRLKYDIVNALIFIKLNVENKTFSIEELYNMYQKSF